jgi:hypothetical protein
VQTPDSFRPHSVNVLTPSGNMVELPYSEIKVVCFVRDFDAGDTWRANLSFASRPKAPGLWMRLVFLDGDTTEGVLANNLVLLDAAGFFVIPPDPSFQNQRLFIPKLALKEAIVLGVIGGRATRSPARKTAVRPDEEQLEMFP